MTDRPGRPDRLKVLYLAGYQRSGSSFLANLLAEQPGWASLGEMRVYWRVCDRPDWMCGCGEPVTACPFWTSVASRLERLRSGWEKPDIVRLSSLTRARHLFSARSREGLDHLEERLGLFQTANEALYQAAAEESRARILVDSSKALLYGQLLDRLPSVDLYVVHLVRDLRGVAHSMAKRAARRRLDPRHGPLGLTLLLDWSIQNRMVESWGRELAQRYVRLRYEDFIASPQLHLDRLRRLLEQAPDGAELVHNGEVDLGIHHTVAGGPHRHDRGRIRLVPDLDWTSRMTVRRRVIELAGARALRRYGYEPAAEDVRASILRPLHVAFALANRLSSSVLKLILNVMIGRMVGPSGAGVYSLFEGWLRVLTTVGGLGLPSIVLRNVSVMEGNRQRMAADRHLRRALSMAVIATGGLWVLVLVAGPAIGPPLLGQAGATYLLLLASLAAVFVATTQLIARAINGRGQANLALALENSSVPGGLVMLLLAAPLVGLALQVQVLLMGYVGVALATAGISYLVWRHGLRGRREPEPGGPPPRFHVREMGTFWVLAVVGALTANLPLLVLPQLFSSTEIGLFGISFRFVTMADTVNIALMAVFAPRFARHFARMDRRALGRDLLESQAYGLLAYMPFVIAYYSFPVAVLSIVGPAFTQAAGILKIMTLGQMVNAATGPSTILLQMTKEESWLLRINVPSLALLALLMVGLGWRFGLAGAAWGYSLSVAVRNLAVYARARHTLRAPAGGGGG